MTEATVLVGKGRQGDFVHRGQKMATDKAFRNVSQKWLDKCITFDQALHNLADGQAETDDIKATVGKMRPVINDRGEFVLTYTDGREFRPTKFAVNQMADWARCGTWFASSLLDNPEDAKGRQLYARDRSDAETLCQVFKNGFRRLNEEKTFLWRTRKDGTLRAMLTDVYAIIPNAWFLEALKKLVPGGLCSHWRGDVDSLYGNILIPDSVRQERDSDYGGMLSISNSEIGQRILSSCPSVFRAICQNGCIWDQEVGAQINVRHRGDINLDELYVKLQHNLQVQIPLIPSGIDALLGTRTMGWDGDSVLPLFAQVSRQYKLSKRQASGLLTAYNEERSVVGDDLAKTLFGVVNTVTRAGQALSNDEWVRMDLLGGELTRYDDDDWRRLTGRAKNLKGKEVEEAFAVAVSSN